MNINLRPKKCSRQIRYGRYSSYATEQFQETSETVKKPYRASYSLYC